MNPVNDAAKRKDSRKFAISLFKNDAKAKHEKVTKMRNAYKRYDVKCEK